MSDFGTSDLSSLWIQAGGSPDVASLMGAIGMAESGGNPSATNPSSGACGLWQIYPPEPGCNDPFSNAQIAVRKYNTQGLGAWEAYTNGSYKQFYDGGAVLFDSTQSSSVPCATFSWDFQGFAGIGSGHACFDGVIGIGAMILGLTLIATAVAIIVMHSRTVRSLSSDAATIATVVPK